MQHTGSLRLLHVEPELGADSFSLTFQLLLIRNVTLDEHRPLCFKLLVQGSLAFLPGLRVAVQQGYLGGEDGSSCRVAGWTDGRPRPSSGAAATPCPRAPAVGKKREGKECSLRLTFAPLLSSA